MSRATYSVEPLTPQRVREATFSSARLGHRGLEEGQVRAFCGWVSDELAQMLTEKAALEEEVRQLRERVSDPKYDAGFQPEDAPVQAVYVLSKAQQTADQYVANAQEYSREIAQDARKHRDEILREAKARASVILEEAHASASRAVDLIPPAREPLSAHARELEAEVAYLRTFSDVCRTHLKAYLESLTRSIEEWERAEHQGAAAARSSRVQFSRSAPSNGAPSA